MIAYISAPYLYSQIFDVCWGNEPILNYLISGTFRWRPLGPFRPVEYRNPGGKPPGDYIGLNFYSRCSTSSGQDLFIWRYFRKKIYF